MPIYTCPTCRKTVEVTRKEDAPMRPFCSERCKMLDLAKWFGEEYRIETPLKTLLTEDPAPPPPLTRH